MAQEEISSLLLKVAVDFQSVEQFAAAMPVVVDVAQAVGQQLNSLQIGSPEVFRAKGESLSRAMVAGFQAQALGLTFAGGQSIAGIITERVFGKLDPSTATAYVRDVQKILDNVRLQLPQVDQPLISAASLGSLTNVQSFASGAKNELVALNQQLAKTQQQISVLSGIAVPKTVIQKSPEGGLTFTPSAVKAVGAASSAGGFGQVPQAVTQAFGSPVLKSNGSVNVTQTNAQVQAAIQSAVQAAIGNLVIDKFAVQDKIQNVKTVAQAVGLPASPAVLGAIGSGEVRPPQQVLQQLAAATSVLQQTLQSSGVVLSQAAQRAADAITAASAPRALGSEGVGTVQDQINELAAQAARKAAFQNANLLPAIEDFQGGSTRTPQKRFEELMRGEDITGRFQATGARALLGAINASERSNIELTRGVADQGFGAIPDFASRLLQEAKTFGELRMSFAGFSSDREISSGFARQGSNPVLLELVPGAKALDFNRANPGNSFESEKEFLTSGRFAVESIRRGPVKPNEPIGQYNPEADIIRIRQLATEYDALERRLALPPVRTPAFDAFANSLRGQPLALGPGVGNGPASAVDQRRITALLDEQAARSERFREVLAERGLLAPLTAAGRVDQSRLRPFNQSPFFGPGSPGDPRVAEPLPGSALARITNPAGGIPGAPQLQRGGIPEIAAQRRELVALGQAADDARSRVGSALSVIPAAAAGGAGGRRTGTGFNFGGRGGGGGRRGGGLDFAPFDDFGPGGAFFGGPGGPGFGRGGNFSFTGGGGAPPPPPGGFPPGGGFSPPPPGGFGRGSAGSPFEGGDPLFDRLRRGAKSGLLGREEGDPAEAFARTATSALRFTLAYSAAFAALNLVTGAFSQAINGTIQFEDALTSLNIATERTGRSNEKFAMSLANLGAGRGVDPVQAVEAGARAIGLFGAVDQTREQQEQIATVSTDVATIGAALNPGATVQAIQTQLAGITRSFGIDPLEQERVLDVASFIGRRSGNPASEIFTALGQIGTLGEAGGFDLEQIAAIIANQATSTAQTPQAVAGQLSQVLSKANDPATEAALRGLGVDTSGTTLAEQFEQLAAMQLSKEQTNQVAVLFGRGRSGGAAVNIVRDLDRTNALAEGALNDSEGNARRDFDQVINTVGGQLRTLGSSIKDLAIGVGSSGIFDVLVLLLSGVQAVVDVLDFLVDGFNLIPREARSAAFALAGVAAALTLLGRFGPLSSALTGFAGRSVGFGFLRGTAENVGSRAAAAARLPVGEAFNRVFRNQIPSITSLNPTTRPGPDGLLRAGTAFTGISAVGTGAIIAAGAALAIGIIDNVVEAGAAKRALEKAGSTLSTANTVEEFDSAISQASDAEKKAQERLDFDLFSKDSLTLGLGTLFNRTLGSADEDKAEAQELKRIAEERKQAFEALRETDNASVFQAFDATSIEQGLAELSSRGLTAAQRLDLLNQAFDGLIAKADLTTGAVGVIFQGQGETFSRTVSTDFIGAAQGAVQEQRDRFVGRGLGGGVTPISPLGGLAGLLGAIPGGLGRQAGTEGGSARENIGTFLEGFKDEAGGIRNNLFFDTFQDLNPFGDSRQEAKDKALKGIDEFQAKLADPGTQDALSEEVLNTLRGRGKDPSLGPVSLTDEDVDAIREAQLARLEGLGVDLDSLPKEVRDAFLNSLPDVIRGSVGDFNGVAINSANVGALVTSKVQQAQARSQEIASGGGSDVEATGALVSDLENLRGQVLAAAGTQSDEAGRKQITDRLAALDILIFDAIAKRTAARREEIESVTALDKSRLAEGDVQGEIALDLSSVAQQLALPNLSGSDRRELEAQRNQLNRARAQDALATTAARGLNALPVRDQAGRNNQELENARARLESVAPDSLAAEQAIDLINQIQDRIALYSLDLAAAVGQLGLNPNDSAGASRAALADANARLRDAEASGDPLAIARAQRAQELAGFQVGVTDPIELANAQNRAASDGTGLFDAQVSLVNAQNDLLALRPGTREFFDKQAEINAAGRALAQEQADGAKASRRAGINPGDALANARADVLDARVDLGLTIRGSREYYDALNQLNRAQFELANQEREAARRTRRLGTDSTDSLTQARQDVIDARQRLQEARDRGGDTSREQQDLENAQARERAEAFNRGLGDARIANDLGQTSNAEYLQYLQSERERLAQRIAGMKQTDEGYRQAIEQLQQLDQAIKGANEQFSGQFNLGDIDIPTPFEVRRQIAGGGGGAATSVSNVQVTINGGDLEQVRQVLSQFIGPVALSRSPTVTPSRF